jgi:hypothetical protein
MKEIGDRTTKYIKLFFLLVVLPPFLSKDYSLPPQTFWQE